ncbi:MAG: hypothetical protein IPJ06_04910 [Saprospiraceae bacterium]|nr:hypothetical protein [Saprospiraceae bacterium]
MKQKQHYLLLFLGLMISFVSCTDNYEEGIKNYTENEYENALTYLKQVEKSDENYSKAQSKITEIDSTLRQMEIDKSQRDSTAKAEQSKRYFKAIVEKEKKELEDLKSQLNREIESIKTFDGSPYRNEVSSIQLEIALFATWAKIIRDAETNPNKEINKLGLSFKRKVVGVQKSEFPKLRKNYSEILKQKLWEENIEVKAKGSGYTTLEFEGGIFANNKNKQDTQQTLSEILNLLRFKRINYKWYEYDDEYTYYTLKTGQDHDLVDL